MSKLDEARAAVRDSAEAFPVRKLAALNKPDPNFDIDQDNDPVMPLNYETADGTLDVMMSLDEAAFWFDQVTGASKWSDEVKPKSDLNPAGMWENHNYTRIFGRWSGIYADSFCEQLIIDPEDRKHLSIGDQEGYDEDAWRRADCYYGLYEITRDLPSEETEGTLPLFIRAAIVCQATLQERWISLAEETDDLSLVNSGDRDWNNLRLDHIRALIEWVLPEVRETIDNAVPASGEERTRLDVMLGLFDLQRRDLQTQYKEASREAASRRVKYTELHTALMTRQREEQDANRQRVEESIDRRIGFQLRSFRVQKSLTLKELATHILKITDPTLVVEPYGGLAVLAYDAAIKLEISKLSRLERGDRGKRGIEPNWEAAICTVLGCTERELKYAPLGYQLPGGDPVQIEIGEEVKKGKSQIRLDVRKASHLVPPDLETYCYAVDEDHEDTFTTDEIAIAAAYIPPDYGSFLEETIPPAQKIELMRCIMTYHWPHLAAQVDQVSGLAGGVKIPTRTEIQLKATENAALLDWNMLLRTNAPLHTYVARIDDAAALDAGCYLLGDYDFRDTDGVTGEITGSDLSQPGLDEPAAWISMYVEQMDIGVFRGTPQDEAKFEAKLKDEVAKTARTSSFPSGIKRETIPVLGFARGGGWDMEFADNGNAFEHIETPPVLDNIKDAFAVVVSNDSMEPRYDAGDYLYCHPNKTPRKGDYVVVALTEQRAIVKRFMRQTPDTIHLEQLNPQENLQIDRSDVVRLFVICGTKTA